ncbi:MAG: hypothetical protein FWH03_08065 [Firmicutes bacterium]|nr:hypothetical protein [Bacillota bacterium]
MGIRKTCYLALAAVIFLLCGFIAVSPQHYRAEILPPTVSVSVQSTPPRTVLLGGMPVGLSVKSDGLIVLGVTEIETCVGRVRPQIALEAGDIITHLDGKPVLYIDDITDALRLYGADGAQAELTFLRGGKQRKLTAYPVIEQYTGNYKLGLDVKEFAEGIGTVTYIKPCGEFASLGHPINSMEGSLLIPSRGGNAYNCRIIGCNKGARGSPGDLRGVFVNPGTPAGSVLRNAVFGVYGKFNALPPRETVEIAPRSAVRPGKAQLVTTVKDKPEHFDIEIIKASAQASPSEKGMVIRVTDKRLLNATGGIVQGMSGSPILQNGKLVGAVTHVFTSDPTKGYAVYIDFMYS